MFKWKNPFIKDPELSQLRKETRAKVDKINSIISVLDWNVSDGGVVNLDMKGISTDWSEFVPGMECRILENSPLSAITIVECKILHPFEMQRHWHFETEVIISSNLDMIDMETGKQIGPMETIRFDKNQKHRPKFLQAGTIIVIFSPQLNIV